LFFSREEGFGQPEGAFIETVLEIEEKDSKRKIKVDNKTTDESNRSKQ